MAAPAAGPSWMTQLRAHLLAPRLTWNDRVMLALAAVDVILLAIRRDVPLPSDALVAFVDAVHILDLIIIGVFALEFLASLVVAQNRVAFLKANWYDLVGLIPIHSAILRAFRFGRIIRVYVWGSRFPGEIEEKYGGEAHIVQVFRRYEPVLVEELTDPILVRVLNVLRRVVGQGRFANAVGDGLAARREELHAVVVDAIRKSPALSLAYNVPPFRAGVDEVEKQTMDVIVSALTDPRLDDIIRGALDDALVGLQQRVAEKEWHQTPAAAQPP